MIDEQTLKSWLRRVAEEGEYALVQLTEPVAIHPGHEGRVHDEDSGAVGRPFNAVRVGTLRCLVQRTSTQPDFGRPHTAGGLRGALACQRAVANGVASWMATGSGQASSVTAVSSTQAVGCNKR
jgi:hypothetical protein